MPLTFPSHAAAVLPLKRWKPHWFDTVALTIGSAAPDAAYALDGTWLEGPFFGTPTYAFAHSWLGVFAWSLPLTLLLCALVRWRFGPAGAVASTPAPQRPAGAVPVAPSRWRGKLWQRQHVFAAAIIAASAALGAASHVLWDRLAANPLPDIASSLLGAAAAIWLLARLGWRWPRISWPVVVAGAVALPFLPGATLPHTTGSRLLLVLGFAVLVRNQTAR